MRFLFLAAVQLPPFAGKATSFRDNLATVLPCQLCLPMLLKCDEVAEVLL
jgi:hypothetical protein